MALSFPLEQFVLYKCPCCGKEDAMTGKGTTLRCGSCGKTYLLTETGFLQAQEGFREEAKKDGAEV